MPATLVLALKEEKKEFPCGTILTIGRDKNNDVVLVDLKASRNHAMVRCLGDDDYYLIDGGSSNGSYVNAKRISLPTLLQNGDKITLGSSHFAFIHEKALKQPEADEAGTATVLIKRQVEVSNFVILVADIRGFTTLSETIAIESLTEIMNAWFHAVTDCIQKCLGTVDKFLGDCVYARWEAGSNMTGAVPAALKAACMLNSISNDINEKYKSTLQGTKLKIGVGINAGIAAVGVDKSDTAIGDAVNLTFRLESYSKEMGKDIIIGKDAYQHLPESLWQEKEKTITVKGKTEPVEVCGLTFSEAEKSL
ncbi:MAG: FHA domain-containing protein [Gammaproteobacteria bacterium]|nr:FHA domain-containing protein [Gammaproteobacteria bacterium]